MDSAQSSVKTLDSSNASSQDSEESLESFYKVSYKRRNKPKELTGVVMLNLDSIELFTDEGKKLSKIPNTKHESFRTDQVINFGNIIARIRLKLSAKDFYSGKCFQGPLKTPSLKPFPAPKKEIKVPQGAIVLNEETQIFVEPLVARKLKPHQVEGVKFMYDCVSGQKPGVGGCILADLMGLGKTLQAIALLYTLLRSKAPYGTVLQRGIVVCPATLISNWEAEFRKWIDLPRLKVVVCQGTTKTRKEKVGVFMSSVHCVLVIGYEAFSNFKRYLSKNCDIVVCDEGHRLKNQSTRTAKAISQIQCKRRIILTGTPLQNNLSEFYSCISFVNPDILGDYKDFKRVYADPIERAQNYGASPKTLQLGWSRSYELSVITSQFILRRTGKILEEMLPSRTEILVFLPIIELQKKLYVLFLSSQLARKALTEENYSWAFSLITTVRKIVNHPQLIFTKDLTGLSETENKVWTEAINLYESNVTEITDLTQLSSKFMFIDTLARATANLAQKLVIVSNFTQTLDLIEELCKLREFTYVRLDGKTKIEDRMKLVEEFNSPNHDPFIFLLSLKAGGVGLNLIGANRLVLFEPDWNPSNDKQAMGRIWRDGQKRSVYIYRLFTSGTIEEKIYSRQLKKENLSSVVVDYKNAPPKFTAEYLRELFKLEDHCLTYKEGDNLEDLPDSLLNFTEEIVDLAKVVQPDWNKNYEVEELEFMNSKQGEYYKRKFSEEDN